MPRSRRSLSRCFELNPPQNPYASWRRAQSRHSAWTGQDPQILRSTVGALNFSFESSPNHASGSVPEQLACSRQSAKSVTRFLQ